MLIFLTTALAASHEIDFEFGWTGATSASFNRVADADLLASYGVRAGIGLHRNLGIIAGWQHARTGSVVSNADSSGAPSPNPALFVAAFTGEMFTAGVKLDTQLGRHFSPYLTAQGACEVGTVRLDDNPDDDENLGQVRQGGVTGGFVVGGGAEVPIPVGEGPIAIAPYLELGYTWLAPMDLDSLGTLRMGGFSGRTGVGVRF